MKFFPVTCMNLLLLVFLYRQSGPKNLDAMFGKARCAVLQQNYNLALDLMNQAIVLVSNFLPAIIEKMKLQLAMNDWEQVVDTAQRSAPQLLLYHFTVSLHCLFDS